LPSLEGENKGPKKNYACEDSPRNTEVNGYSPSSCEIRASFKIHPYFKGSPKKMTESSDKQIPKSKKSNIKLKFKGSPKKMTLIQVSNKSDPNRKAEDSRSPSSAKVMAKKTAVIPKPPIPT